VEAGLSVTPGPTQPLSLKFGIQGYAGKREGVTGSFKLNYRFWKTDLIEKSGKKSEARLSGGLAATPPGGLGSPAESIRPGRLDSAPERRPLPHPF
jgi:hypothetical protein